MEILKKSIEIGKSKIFYEFSETEMSLVVEGFKLLLPKKEKELNKLEMSYEGEADIYFKILEIDQDIKFINHLINLKTPNKRTKK